MKEFIRDMQEFLDTNPSKDQISRKKVKLAGKHGMKKVPTDIEIYLNLDHPGRYEKLLVTKPTRTISGVAVVALMTEPHVCPHGSCIYCPGGPESDFGDVPKSYTGREPSTMRGFRNKFDAYLEVMNRLEQYVVIGQNPEKVEIIVMGGTFSFFPEDYQKGFVRDAFRAMNDFSDMFYEDGRFNIRKFKDFFELPGDKNDSGRLERIHRKLLDMKGETSLSVEKERNEDSMIRCVGLTIETRPDYGFKEQGNTFLDLGCTRIELGIQTVYEGALEKAGRGHTIEDSKRSIRELRDLGFKLNFHMMPGLPGVSYEDDLGSLKRLFRDEDFRPDMLKIYPTLVFRKTKLYDMYKMGEYKALTTEQTAEMLSEFMATIPRYCRVMRVQRDIPSSLAIDGPKMNNLRQYIDKKMKDKGIRSEDIRAREIGHRIKGKSAETEPEVNVVEYDASHGKEFFISIDDKNTDSIMGFCRLRFPSASLRGEITQGSSLVRELHVYGTAASVGKRGNVQHKGFGRKLMEKAEKISREKGKEKIVVISGVGVRNYYRKLGYEKEGPYMVKYLYQG